MPVPVMPESVEIEFWLRNDSTKTLLEAFEPDEDGQLRFHYPEDGNIWISFHSADRNKVDEETYLILKTELSLLIMPRIIVQDA